MKEELVGQIQSIFESVLGHSNFKLEADTTANDVDGWDSVTHILIITEIENFFNIKFDLMKLLSLENIEDLVNTVDAMLNDNS